MKPLIGVINLDHELEELKELTYFRCGAAVPYAGRYRLIDFVLSNMMNAGIESIGVFVRRKYRSLMDHLGTVSRGSGSQAWGYVYFATRLERSNRYITGGLAAFS